MPVLVLWGVSGGATRGGRDVLAVWRQYASDVQGRELPCGHYLAEEMPEEVYGALRTFLG